MRKTPTLITFVTIVTLGGATSPARADELVQVAPHRADVQPASSKDTPPLLAYLARPVGAGPFPAAVVLHSCGGFSRHDTEAAARLKSRVSSPWRSTASVTPVCVRRRGAPQPKCSMPPLRYL